MKSGVALLILVAGLVLQIGTGALGVGRHPGDVHGFDFAYLYAAGSSWLNHANPYVIETLKAYNTTPVQLPSGFVYPPQSSVFSMALALLSFDVAARLVGVLNIAALIFLAWYVQVMAAAPFSVQSRPEYPGNWLLAALVMFSPFAASVIWMGQTSIFLTVALICGWGCAERGQHFASGLLFAVAMIKPQFSLLPFLWLCMNGSLGFYAGFALAFTLLGVGAWLTDNPLVTVHTWLESIHHYRSIEFNVPGNEHVTAMQSVLVAAGLTSTPDLMFVAIVLAGVFWIFRRRFCRDAWLTLLLLIGFVFIPAHDYDFVALVPVFAMLWRHGESRIHSILMPVCFAVAMYVPQRVVRMLDVQALLHWRDIIVLSCLIYIAYLCRQEASPSKVASKNALGSG
jgi:hypothetical protein